MDHPSLDRRWFILNTTPGQTEDSPSHREKKQATEMSYFLTAETLQARTWGGTSSVLKGKSSYQEQSESIL